MVYLNAFKASRYRPMLFKACDKDIFRYEGNAAGSTSGGGQTAGDVKSLMANTPFTQREVQMLMKRYSAYDNSEQGHVGISLADCVSMSEFAGGKFIVSILEAHLDENTQRIHPKSFLSVCSLLSSKTPPEAKKNYLFQLVDVYDTGVLTHDEMFRIYKLLFGGAITDDHILDLTFRALRHPDLNRPGEITREEFFRMVPDNEISSRLTVDFNFAKL